MSILQLQLLPWFQKHTIHLQLLLLQADKEEEEQAGFWGLKNVIKEKKELQLGRSILLKW
jgi:hypothetical protein